MSKIKYSIQASDSNNWTVISQQKVKIRNGAGKATGGKKIREIKHGYFPKLGQAANWLLERMMKEKLLTEKTEQKHEQILAALEQAKIELFSVVRRAGKE